MMHKRSTGIYILSRLTIFCILCQAFTFEIKHSQRHSRQIQRTQLDVIPAEILSDVEASRTQFFGWFFGASGGAGIARSAFPRMYEQVQLIRSLKGNELSLGGETLGLNPLCGYPEDLSIKDLENIVNNKMTVEKIVQKYPIENNFLSRKGYITFAAFEMANKGANPLAIRAIFDTFAQSTDACDPFLAQDKIDSYKEDITLIKGAIFKAKVTGYVAIFTLLFLLGLADVIAFGHARDGWFPYWKLSDGVLDIPDFWI